MGLAMAVKIAPVGRQQFFDNQGRVAAGMKLFTYLATTTTKQATFTTAGGGVQNANPIVLDSAGRTPAGLWLTDGVLYKFVLAPANDTDPPTSPIWTEDNIASNDASLANLANTSNPALGDALIGFKQSNSGGVLTGATARTVHDKLQEIVSPEDFACAGDGTTDDRANFQAAIDAVNASGGGLLRCSPGRTYLIRKKAAVTKNIGSHARSYALELPNNVLIDLNGSTIKGYPSDGDYCLISNVTTTAVANSNSNLGFVNGVIDGGSGNGLNYDGDCECISFYGVRKLKVDDVEIRNCHTVAFNMEVCDEFDIGDIVIRTCYGAAFAPGVSRDSGGGEISKGRIGSVTTYDVFDHPSNPGVPGNPFIIGTGAYIDIGTVRCHDSDAGIKISRGNDITIGRAIFDGGPKQNGGFKLQGDVNNPIARISVGEVISRDCGGPGLMLTWCEDVKIGSYTGYQNGGLGLDEDIRLAGVRTKIGSMSSVSAGLGAVNQTLQTTSNNNKSVSCTVDSLEIVNPFVVTTTGTATGLIVTNGSMKIGKLRMVDTRATPRMIRYFGSSSQTKEQSISIDEFYGRGASGNPDFITAGLQKLWVGNPDISPLNFAGGTLTLSSAAVGTGVTATAGSAVFASTDVGKIIASVDGKGFSEITGFTSTTVVTVANRIAWAVGVNVPDDDWYLDRGTGGQGEFTPSAAATSTTVTDYGFINTTSRGFPIIACEPTNAAGRTLGPITTYTFAGTTVTFNHASAAGTETYRYRILGWTGA